MEYESFYQDHVEEYAMDILKPNLIDIRFQALCNLQTHALNTISLYFMRKKHKISNKSSYKTVDN